MEKANQILIDIWRNKLNWSEERIESQCIENNWIYPSEKKPTPKTPGYRGVITIRPTPENRFILNERNKNYFVNLILSAYQKCKRCRREVEDGI